MSQDRMLVRQRASRLRLLGQRLLARQLAAGARAPLRMSLTRSRALASIYSSGRSWSNSYLAISVSCCSTMIVNWPFPTGILYGNDLPSPFFENLAFVTATPEISIVVDVWPEMPRWPQVALVIAVPLPYTNVSSSSSELGSNCPVIRFGIATSE